MEWISSEGGPLILISKKYLSDWHGIVSSDYSMACDIDNYAGTIKTSNTQALVLGDDPCQSAIYISKGLGAVIVRWQWAESENSVQKYIDYLTAEDFQDPVEEIEYRVDDSALLLFDSVMPGSSVEGLTLNLPIATYVITTICYVPDDETSLILHRFTPKLND